jgi:hypothetical protein
MIPIRRLLKEICDTFTSIPPNIRPTFHCCVFEDNNGALNLAVSHRTTSRTRHFHVEWHHFWENMNDGEVEIFRIATSEQLADYFSKPLTRTLFEANRLALQGF